MPIAKQVYSRARHKSKDNYIYLIDVNAIFEFQYLYSNTVVRCKLLDRDASQAWYWDFKKNYEYIKSNKEIYNANTSP